MSFYRPESLWLLLAVPLILLVALPRYFRARAALAALGAEAGLGGFGARYWIEAAGFALFAAAAAVAAADPAWGSERVAERRAGLDVAVAVDVSRSMLAADAAPTRLARARSEVAAIIAANPGARFSVVAFKGSAVELVPLTDDAEALAGALDALDPGMLSSTGTDLEAGVAAAARSFGDDLDSARVVLLCSDGESLAGDAGRAARDAAEGGARVFCLGIGSPEGSRVAFGDGGQLRDSKGAAVVSRLDEPALRRIAAETGGLYAAAGDQQAMGELSRAISDAARGGEGSSFRMRPVRRYGLFAAIALAALAASYAAGFMRWERTR